MRPGSDESEWREDCAPRRVLELFSTKWTSMVLHTLPARHAGRARAGVLLRSLPGISKKMLTQTLREMEASGPLTRHVKGTVPPAVEYRLTELGIRFVKPVELLYGGAAQTRTRSIASVLADDGAASGAGSRKRITFADRLDRATGIGSFPGGRRRPPTSDRKPPCSVNRSFYIALMDTKAKLVAAAEIMFDRHGFTATGMDRLTEAAGMSSRTLYKHAGSKVALMTTVLSERNARFMAAIDVVSVDDLFAALAQWQRAESARGCMLLRTLAETGGDVPEIAEVFTAHKVEFREKIAEIVATDLCGRSDPVLAEQVLVLFEGASVSAVYRGTEAVKAARSAAAVLVSAARR